MARAAFNNDLHAALSSNTCLRPQRPTRCCRALVHTCSELLVCLQAAKLDFLLAQPGALR